MQNGIKLFVLTLTLGIFVAAFMGAKWVWKEMFENEPAAQAEINQILKANPERPDPGLSVYQQALDHLKNKDIVSARASLQQVLTHYQDSARFSSAKALLGEMNIDLLFSNAEQTGKKEHIVQRGDSMALIAQKNKTSMEYLIRANRLFGTTLQPGDRLLTADLSFEVVIKLSDSTLTLLRRERFFKEYPLESCKLPSGMKAPFETKISAKGARHEAKAITVLNPNFLDAEKTITFARPGLVLRARSSESTAVDLGFQLSKENLEELYTLLTPGTLVKIVL